MEWISVTEAAKRKGCSGQAIRDAIKKGLIDAIVIGRTNVVITTMKFEEWKPNPNYQKGGRARAKKAKSRIPRFESGEA